jgi:hypothetical protein
VVDAENSTVSGGGNAELRKASKKAKVFGVYTHARPDGTVFYVGKGTEKRARELVNCRRNNWHTQIVRKYGVEAITVQFFACGSEANALEREIELIKQYREIGVKLVNLTDGGQGTSGYKHTAVHCEQLSRRFKGKKKSAEQIAKMRAVMLGRFISAETREKMSASRRGKPCSEKRRAAV